MKIAGSTARIVPQSVKTAEKPAETVGMSVKIVVSVRIAWEMTDSVKTAISAAIVPSSAETEMAVKTVLLFVKAAVMPAKIAQFSAKYVNHCVKSAVLMTPAGVVIAEPAATVFSLATTGTAVTSVP